MSPRVRTGRVENVTSAAGASERPSGGSCLRGRGGPDGVVWAAVADDAPGSAVEDVASVR